MVPREELLKKISLIYLRTNPPPSCLSVSSSSLSSVLLCPARTPPHLPPPLSVYPCVQAGQRARHAASIVPGVQHQYGLWTGQTVGSVIFLHFEGGPKCRTPGRHKAESRKRSRKKMEGAGWQKRIHKVQAAILTRDMSNEHRQPDNWRRGNTPFKYKID